MSNKQRTVSTTLQCGECGSVMPIQRKAGRQREKNHIKHMFCYGCRKEQGFIEVKEDVDLPAWLQEDNYSYEKVKQG